MASTSPTEASVYYNVFWSTQNDDVIIDMKHPYGILPPYDDTVVVETHDLHTKQKVVLAREDWLKWMLRSGDQGDQPDLVTDIADGERCVYDNGAQLVAVYDHPELSPVVLLTLDERLQKREKRRPVLSR